MTSDMVVLKKIQRLKIYAGKLHKKVLCVNITLKYYGSLCFDSSDRKVSIVSKNSSLN